MWARKTRNSELDSSNQDERVKVLGCCVSWMDIICPPNLHLLSSLLLIVAFRTERARRIIVLGTIDNSEVILILWSIRDLRRMVGDSRLGKVGKNFHDTCCSNAGYGMFHAVGHAAHMISKEH
jgi:hypothetical protein